MVDPVNITSNPLYSSIPATKGNTKLGKDDFMKLLITQMKYQDPMNPMDGSQYAAQLAQFSSLEQLSNMNSTLQTSLDGNLQLTQSVNNTMTAALIGKEAKLSGNTFKYNGQETFNFGYNLPSTAGTVDVKIYDKAGSLIKTINNCPLEQGEHKLSWDFTDNNGVKVGNGEYKFEVTAKATNQQEITTNAFKFGIISGIRFTENGMRLIIDKTEYLLSDISEIVNP